MVEVTQFKSLLVNQRYLIDPSKVYKWDFPGGSVVKILLGNEGDTLGYLG